MTTLARRSCLEQAYDQARQEFMHIHKKLSRLQLSVNRQYILKNMPRGKDTDDADHTPVKVAGCHLD